MSAERTRWRGAGAAIALLTMASAPAAGAMPDPVLWLPVCGSEMRRPIEIPSDRERPDPGACHFAGCAAPKRRAAIAPRD